MVYEHLERHGVYAMGRLKANFSHVDVMQTGVCDENALRGTLNYHGTPGVVLRTFFLGKSGRFWQGRPE